MSRRPRTTSRPPPTGPAPDACDLFDWALAAPIIQQDPDEPLHSQRTQRTHHPILPQCTRTSLRSRQARYNAEHLHNGNSSTAHHPRLRDQVRPARGRTFGRTSTSDVPRPPPTHVRKSPLQQRINLAGKTITLRSNGLTTPKRQYSPIYATRTFRASTYGDTAAIRSLTTNLHHNQRRPVRTRKKPPPPIANK